LDRDRWDEWDKDEEEIADWIKVLSVGFETRGHSKAAEPEERAHPGAGALVEEAVGFGGGVASFATIGKTL
jgi:hypothetical protein